MELARNTKANILEVLAGLPDPGLAAKARAIYRTQKFITGSEAPTALRRWSEKAEDEIRKCSASYKSAHHPADVLADSSMRKVDKLSPSDLVWLQKLPSDPAQITFQDAARLGHLNASINKVENPSDGNLIASIWGPVKDHHDLRRAEAMAHNASLAAPTLHLESVEFLGKLIQDEMPGLSDAAAAEEARDLICKAEAQRTRRTDEIRVQAETLKAQVRERVKERTALVND